MAPSPPADTSLTAASGGLSPRAAQRPGGLDRSLGVAAAGAFVVTNMVGSGIFTLPAFVRHAVGGGPAALGVWLAGAMLALAGALCYGELATRMPRAGGEYRYLADVYGPLWGFLSGWVSFLSGFSAAIAAAALGVVAYADPLLGGWDAGATIALPLLPFSITQGAAAAALLVLLFTAAHSLGVAASGRLQSLLALAVLAAIVALVAAGLGTGRGELHRVSAASTAHGSWWVALIQVSFAYSGWNAAAYLAGEVRRPARSLPWALVGGTALVAIAYLLLNVLFLYAIPVAEWQPQIAVGQEAASRLFGDAGAAAVTAIIALAILGSVSAMTAAGPRVYFAMARDGLAPGLLQRLGRRRVPVAATVAQGVFAALLALTGAFEALLVYIGSALLLFSSLAVAAVFVLRRREEKVPEGVFRVPGYPVTPALFLLVAAVAWIEGLRRQPVPTLAALATVGLGALVYLLGKRQGWVGGD